MYRQTVVCRRMPPFQITPESTPVKVTSYMKYLGKSPNTKWYNYRTNEFVPIYRERSSEQTWPYTDKNWTKEGSGPVLKRWYSRDALQAAVNMIPAGFEVQDVPRPPQRIRAQSEGMVGRWYTNYWTLHSVKYQCLLAGVEWKHGERVKPRSNFDEPYIFVDYDESKMVRDARTRWINIHRSMAGMTNKVFETEQEQRFKAHKKLQDTYWSNRRVMISRLKSMRTGGNLEDGDPVPIKSMKLGILDE